MKPPASEPSAIELQAMGSRPLELTGYEAMADLVADIQARVPASAAIVLTPHRLVLDRPLRLAVWLAAGAIAPGGRLPVNTNGGGLSCTHPGMYGIFALIEAVQQLRGDGGERQVPGVSTALAHGNGGTLSSQSTAILGTADAL